MKRLLIVVACLLAAACTTTDTRTAMSVTAPTPGATILLVKPDVELALLTTVGLSETCADWTEQGTTNLAAALQSSVHSSSTPSAKSIPKRPPTAAPPSCCAFTRQSAPPSWSTITAC